MHLRIRKEMPFQAEIARKLSPKEDRAKSHTNRSLTRFVLFLIALFFFPSCVTLPQKELAKRPDVVATPSEVSDLLSLVATRIHMNEWQTPWGRELACGWIFAKEGDFFRAISSFKKALIFLDNMEEAKALNYDLSNRLKIEAVTGVVASYLFNKKYAHVIEAWDSLSPSLQLRGQQETKWLLIMMVQALSASKDSEERAHALALMLPENDPDRVPLILYTAIRSQSKLQLEALKAVNNPMVSKTSTLFTEVANKSKNPDLAFGMNLLLPGSGYAYLDQWSTGFTSLTINGLFIGAIIEFFKAHQPMAACIALGLELGWWAGGASGARLATYEYNHQLWLRDAEKFMRANMLYPEAILWRTLHADPLN